MEKQRVRVIDAMLEAPGLGARSGRNGDLFLLMTSIRPGLPQPLDMIEGYVSALFATAKRNPHEIYDVTPVGLSAGYSASQMAPLFADAPKNVRLPPEFSDPS